MRTAKMNLRGLLMGAVSALTLAVGASAQTPPQPLPMPPEILAPRDVPYPGTITLAVDATDVTRRIFRMKETIPVHGGPVTLLFPKWQPGNHSPTGRIDSLAGLVIQAGGKRVEWTRDPVDVFAFHVDAPAGTTALDLEFQFLAPAGENQGRVIVTPDMLDLEWISTTLYPAGYYARQIMVTPSVTLPDGWDFATALETASSSGATKSFKTVPFETLADSPLLAGRYSKKIDLDPSGPAPVRLNIFADRPEQLEAKPEYIEVHKNLVVQAYKLFGSHHYDHYDFLFGLSDRMGGEGLEHHRSSEDITRGGYFLDWDKVPGQRNLLAHEYTHSWNGKFRRPADLWTPNYNVPMRGSLLWVYEGQTQYWGYVLSARAGMTTAQQALDAIASTAAVYDTRSGREWKTLEDTTNDPIVAMRRAIPSVSWQRSEDYYSEGELVWMDADTLIRELSGGKKSLDDFASAFFGVYNSSWADVTYTFNDMVKALNAVQPYDWAKFLRTRLDGHGPGAPLDGVTRGGYKLVYTDTPTEFFKDGEAQRKVTDLSYSLGIVVGREGKLNEVRWGSPAHTAGMTVGGQIMAVNGIAYDSDRLKDAIKGAKTGKTPIAILVKTDDTFATLQVDYHDGLRYPRLERNASVPDRLGDILTAKK